MFMWSHLLQPVRLRSRCKGHMDDEERHQEAHHEHKVSDEYDHTEFARPGLCKLTPGGTLCFLEPASHPQMRKARDCTFRRPYVNPPKSNSNTACERGAKRECVIMPFHQLMLRVRAVSLRSNIGCTGHE